MTYRELLSEAIRRLEKAGFDRNEAESDAWFLLSGIFGIDRSFLLLHGTEEAGEKADRFIAAVGERMEHVPVAHILGEWDFMGMTFKVSPDVLVPRADTETLVERVLESVKTSWRKEKTYRILDLCTGSGCIAISLWHFLHEGHKVEVTATDISEKALAVAETNAELLNAPITLRQGDLFEAADGLYDVITCNPPYIRSSEIGTLSEDVRDHDPLLALDGGEDGLDFYRRIAEEAGSFLSPEGILALEIGEDQGTDVPALFGSQWDKMVFQDLGGNDRVVLLKHHMNE